MTEPIELPPELQLVADVLSEQPPEVRDMFRYALVLAMIDDEKAHVIGTRVEEEREWLTVETVAGDVFEIERPAIDGDMEAKLLENIRQIVAEESGEDGA